MKTSTNNRWSPQRLTEKITRHCDEEYNHRSYFEEPYEELLAAINSGEPRIYFQFSYLSMWYKDDGLRKLMSGRSDGLIALHHSVYFSEAHFQKDAARRKTVVGADGMIGAGRAAADVALAVSLGCSSYAERIIGIVFESPNGVLGGLDFTMLPAYIFRLYASWAGMSLPQEIDSLEIRTPYTEVLSMWKSKDISNLGKALTAACDYHVERSRYDNNREYFEFNLDDLALQPVEILAVLRLRENLGLENPVIDHPVLNTPVGKLYTPIQVEPDPIIAPALEVARAQWASHVQKKFD